MNKETYEALKRIIKIASIRIYFMIDKRGEIAQADLKQVEDWIDEVAKEYEEEVC